MLPSVEELYQMMNIDIRSVDREQLVDIQDVEIDEKKTVKTRIHYYIEKLHNPYFMKVGDYVVKVSYQESGEELDERVLAYVSQMTKIK